MFCVIDHGGEKLSNNFACVSFNEVDKTYHIVWNTFFRSPNRKVFKVSNDYDFGAIDVKDSLIEAYNNPSLIVPGIELINR